MPTYSPSAELDIATVVSSPERPRLRAWALAGMAALMLTFVDVQFGLKGGFLDDSYITFRKDPRIHDYTPAARAGEGPMQDMPIDVYVRNGWRERDPLRTTAERRNSGRLSLTFSSAVLSMMIRCHVSALTASLTAFPLGFARQAAHPPLAHLFASP